MKKEHRIIIALLVIIIVLLFVAIAGLHYIISNTAPVPQGSVVVDLG